MRRTIAGFAVLALGAWSFCAGQNARLNAMGGVDIVKDPSNVLRIAAFMNDYPDLVQATASGTGLGYSMGIKSLGDVLRVGFLSRPNPVLSDRFYDDAGQILNRIDQAPRIQELYPIPHFLLGLDFGGLKVGFDVFLETALSRYRSESTNPPSEVKASKLIFHPGAVASLLIGGEEFYIAPFVGAGLPMINGRFDNGNAAQYVKIDSRKGYYMTAGAELGLEAGVSWVLGGSYSMELYQFSRRVGDPGTEDLEDTYPGQMLNTYAGFTSTILEDVLLGIEYGFGIAAMGRRWGDDPPVNSSTDIYFSHRIGAGVEKPIEGFWIFDQLIPRAGFWAFMGDPMSVRKTENGPDEQTTITYEQAFRTTADPTVGVGVSKGRFKLDVNVSLGSWAGLIAGPNVLEGTLTLDFGAQAASSRPRSVSSSSPRSEPASQTFYGSSTYVPPASSQSDTVESSSSSSSYFGSDY